MSSAACLRPHNVCGHPTVGRRRHHTVKITAQDTNGTATKAPKPKDTRNKPFTNINRFQVPPPVTYAFESVLRQREQDMAQFKGFLGLTIDNTNGKFVVQSRWASIPDWEDYSYSAQARRSHLPNGIYQYVPGKGEGFPEDFIPFAEMSRAVDAKY